MTATHTKSLKCPICGVVAVKAYTPFCSRRCADVDLGRWFSGSYAVAGRLEDEATQDALKSPDGGANDT